MMISFKKIDKNQLRPVQDGMQDAPGLSHCHLLRNPRTNPSGVLEHFREKEANFLRRFY